MQFVIWAVAASVPSRALLERPQYLKKQRLARSDGALFHNSMEAESNYSQLQDIGRGFMPAAEHRLGCLFV